MRVGFFGSGEFGRPTLEHLVAGHEVQVVISQPDRPAGRRRQLRATPISECAVGYGLPLERPDRLDEASIGRIRSYDVEAWVVIAYGLKLPPAMLEGVFACNLHGSLLPRWRGAAPIQRALMAGDSITGVSVITLAEIMDAGDLLAIRKLEIDPEETAGELHDRLAALGPGAIQDVLDQVAAGILSPQPQPTEGVTHAAKLSRSEATCDFRGSAETVRGWIHGLSPWPGCDVRSSAGTLRLRRVRAVPGEEVLGAPGDLLPDGRVACGRGAIEIRQVQIAGGRPMAWDEFRRGRDVGARLEAM